MNKFEAPKIEVIMFNTPESTIGTNYLSGAGEIGSLSDEGYADELTF